MVYQQSQCVILPTYVIYVILGGFSLHQIPSSVDVKGHRGNFKIQTEQFGKS
jgi:hypothetical protein